MKIIQLVFLLLVGSALFAQVPSQKEIDEMMKKAQDIIKNAGAEMPDEFPKKDAARIAIAQKYLLTDAALPSFIQKVNMAIAAKLDAKLKATAEQVYQSAKKEQSVANAATGLWIQGAAAMATYLMGKAAADDANADNLNNYAAFLTMTGAEEAAIPLLLNLNKHFPGNSTILNNIGQAWFGLGEMVKANKYLDSAILIYALHPQANYTKCLLLEKSDPVKAIDAMKRSIAGAYSKEKESKLRDLEYELKSDDINWDFPVISDALGLNRFYLPAYPKTAAESAKLQQEWKAFRNACNEKIKELEARNQRLRTELEENAGHITIPFYHYKAMKKLLYLIEDKDGAEAYNRQKTFMEEQQTFAQVDKLRKQMDNELSALPGIHGDGEGAGNAKGTDCSRENAIINKYLPQASKLLMQTRMPVLERMRKTLNNQAYFNMYTMEPLTFEYMKNSFKITWLNELVKSRVEFWRCNPQNKEEDNLAIGSLPDFDDIHCERYVEFNFFSTKLTLDCSRLTSEIKLPVLRLSMKENLNSNEIIRGTLEVGYFVGGTINNGPVRGEFKGEAGVTMEFDKNGVSDVGVRGKAMMGEKVGGMDIRYGWNAGGSVQGKGFYRGIKI